MTITLSSARILVVSRTPDDSAYMQDFFARIEDLPTPDFVVGKTVPADKYDFIVFDARSLPPAPNIEAFTKLPDDIQAHYFLLDNYLRDTAKYIVFFGKYYYNLNQERCPSANSKFSLFARIRELIDFINHYKSWHHATLPRPRPLTPHPLRSHRGLLRSRRRTHGLILLHGRRPEISHRRHRPPALRGGKSENKTVQIVDVDPKARRAAPFVWA